MKKRRATFLVALIITVMLISACGQEDAGMESTSGTSSETSSKANDESITVAVSIVPQETFVKAVAGDLVDVVTMIPPGASPANYQPSPKEMVAFSNASVYFSIGVPTEEANILPNIAEQEDDLLIIELADVVDAVYPARTFADDHHDHVEHDDHDEHEHDDHDEHEHDDHDEHEHDDHDEHEHDDHDEHEHDDHDEHEHDDHDEHEHDNHDGHDHSGRDPHIWLSPKRVVVMVEEIQRVLSEMDPDNAATYKANAESYIDKLQALDAETAAEVETLAFKKFIIMHPSMGYFADDYGLEMFSIEEDGKEASAAHMQRVIDYGRDNDIHVIFYQQEFDSTQAETIGKELDAHVLSYEPLTADYIEGIRKLVETFKGFEQ